MRSDEYVHDTELTPPERALARRFATPRRGLNGEQVWLRADVEFLFEPDQGRVNPRNFRRGRKSDPHPRG